MSEKRTLSRWLRNETVYQENNSDAHESTNAQSANAQSTNAQWRDALLLEFDPQISKPLSKPREVQDERLNLQAHHLAWLVFAGLALFLLGWMFGSQVISVDKISKVSPWVWVGTSMMTSVGFFVVIKIRHRRDVY